MEVLLFLLLSSIFTVPAQGRWDNHTCQISEDCDTNEYCDSEHEKCVCKAGFHHEHHSDNCEPCPHQGEECESCCFPPETLTCYRDNQSYKTCNAHFNHSFIMAAQVALGAALAVAFVALIALFWKTCPRGNSRGGLSSLLRDRESSLTSMQRFVLQRLRDRPPRYEDNNQIQLEKPPAYEEMATIANIQVPDSSPPCYSESIQEGNENKQIVPRDSQVAEVQRNSVTNSPSSSSGSVNPTFTITDEEIETRHMKQKETSRSRTGSRESGRINVLLTEETNEATQQTPPQAEHYI